MLITSPHLIISIAATVGKPCINYVPTAIHDGFIVLLNHNFNINFMFNWFEKNQKIWLKYGQPGAQINLNSSIIGKQKLYLPNKNEQNKISQILNVLNNLITLYERKSKLLSQIKEYLLDNLFAENEYPNLRFKGFTNVWEQGKLGEFSYIKGRIGWKSLKHNEYLLKGPALIASKHINNGQINWNMVDHISDWRYEESPEIMLKINDIIFSKDGAIGNPAIIKSLPCKATINSTMMLVRLDLNTMYADFFYQILVSNQFKRLVFEKTSGSSIPHIFQSDMKEFKFCFPCLKEQKIIYKMLNKLDYLLALYEDKLKQIKQIKKELLDTMFI